MFTGTIEQCEDFIENRPDADDLTIVSMGGGRYKVVRFKNK